MHSSAWEHLARWEREKTAHDKQLLYFLQEWTLHQCFSAGMLSRISKSAVHMYERVACVWPAYVWHCVLCCVWCLWDKWMCLKGIYEVPLLLLVLLPLLNQYPWDVFAIFLPRLGCLLGSGRSGRILNRVEPEALIQRQPAQPNLGSEDDTRCVVGGISGLWRSGALTFLQAECSNEKSARSVAGKQGQGLTCISRHTGAALVVRGAGARQYNQSWRS